MVDTSPDYPNELHPELLGICGINPYHAYNSPARVQMMSNHIAQALVIEHPTERYTQSGTDRQYGKATYAVKMPEDGQIIAVIERYPRGTDIMSIPRNEAQTIVLYRQEETGIIDYFELKGHHSEQSHFGFRYAKTEHCTKLVPNAYIPKGEVFLRSPNLTDNGDYRFGREANVAYMSHPAVSEDGIVICRDQLEHYAVRTYERREVEFGSRHYPLNLYGDDTEYKIFPEIGSLVREDGKLMTLRRDIRDAGNGRTKNQHYQDRSLAMTQKTVKGLQTPCNFTDKSYYAIPGGKIVDIRVYHDDTLVSAHPVEFEKQIQRYQNATRAFYQRLLDEHQKLKIRYGSKEVKLSYELHGLMVQAKGAIGPGGTTAADRVVKQYRTSPMDEWRVEFTIEYKTYPTEGSKLTDLHGGKGVICYIAEPHEMPVDALGNRADFIMDGRATLNRMNLGRNYETYLNSASRDVIRRIVEKLHVDPKDPHLKLTFQEWEANQYPPFLEAWEYLMGYFKIVSPNEMYPHFAEGHYEDSKAQYLSYCLNNFIYLYIPANHQTSLKKVVDALEADPQYTPHFGPVMYTGYSGKPCVTHVNVRIGSCYIILLEKIGDDWTAVSSGKRQHFGVLSQLTSWDKYSNPTRTNAVRALGETEVRISASYAGPELTAELLDRSNNPDTSRMIADRLMSADYSTNVDRLIDRKLHPLGGSRPLRLVKHMAECQGWRLVYKPYVAAHHSPQPPFGGLSALNGPDAKAREYAKLRQIAAIVEEQTADSEEEKPTITLGEKATRARRAGTRVEVEADEIPLEARETEADDEVAELLPYVDEEEETE